MLWLELPPQIDANLLAQQALAQHISIAPGTIFSPTAPGAASVFGNFIRLNCAVVQDARLQRALQALAQLCQQQLAAVNSGLVAAAE